VEEVWNDVVAVGVDTALRLAKAIDISVVGNCVIGIVSMYAGVLAPEDKFGSELRLWRLYNLSEVKSAADSIVALDPSEDAVSGTAHAKSLAVAVEAVVRVYGVI
jgi:hypothetical protein